jgi:hypothetical protein
LPPEGGLPWRHGLISGAAGVGAALLVWFHYDFSPGAYSDFDQIWLSARALLAGQNPYLTVPASFPWPNYYPLAAHLLAVPLAPLPLSAARCAIAFLTGAAATRAVLRNHRHGMLLLATGPFLYAIQRGQWSPLILAACLIPAWGIIAAAKPTAGLAAILYRPSRTAVLGAVLLTLLSLLVMPRWPLDWLAAVSEQRHLRAPLLLPGGFLIGLVLLRWRRPEARLLLLLAAVPQTVVPYELVPLAVVPHTRREVLLVVATWTAVYLMMIVIDPAPLARHELIPADYRPHGWWVMLVFGYLPILGIILRRGNAAPQPSTSPG